MATVLLSMFPEKSPELFTYLATVGKAEYHYEQVLWVLYDRQFRRKALTPKNLDLFVTDSRMYNKPTRRAHSMPIWTFCRQDDHSLLSCPQNLTEQWLGLLLEAAV